MNPSRSFSAFVTAAIVCLSAGCGQSDRTLAIATGGPAGLYYPFGGGMASLWSEVLPGVNAKAEVTGGSVTNVIQVARGESDLGIAMADVVTSAYAGTGRFPEPLPLRVLFTAYPNIVHVLTLRSSGIESINDLVGRRVAIGAQGSGTAVAATNMLNGLGLSLQDIAPRYLSFGETTTGLKDGTLDAGFVVGGLGIAAVTELAVTRDIQIISLTEAQLAALTDQYPAYSGYTIPAGTYAGVDEPRQALGIWSAVVVHEAMPEELAYALTCAVYQEHSRLLSISPVVKDMTLDNIHQLTAVPLHAGTRRYLQNPTANCLASERAEAAL
ncbi:MAG: TAXI family TRAP transporter solute-binding subunit [Gammaproteobacteria bacterium]|jgi:TRAP transporter TAXI family solute receptor